MKILDLFAGTGSATKAFEDAGHIVIKVELDEYFEADERDILKLTPEYLEAKYGKFDFIWASPPCTTFSVASIGKHWNKDKTPKTSQALEGIKLVEHTLALIKELNPSKGWIMENPRGMLRKQTIVKNLTHRTITYCQYGDTRMKPTDLWGWAKNWTAKEPCRNGDSCHIAAPRGSKTGTQGIKGAKNRSMIPYKLGEEICKALENDTPENQKIHAQT